jgi:predicted nucleic acid-binding protein
MNDLVIDSSVAIKWFVVESYSTEARLILDDYEVGSLNFLAPDLLNAEFGNILWKKHVFQGLAANDAEDMLDKFRQLPISFVSTQELLSDAYQIAVT